MTHVHCTCMYMCTRTVWHSISSVCSAKRLFPEASSVRVHTTQNAATCHPTCSKHRLLSVRVVTTTTTATSVAHAQTTLVFTRCNDSNEDSRVSTEDACQDVSQAARGGDAWLGNPRLDGDEQRSVERQDLRRVRSQNITESYSLKYMYYVMRI